MVPRPSPVPTMMLATCSKRLVGQSVINNVRTRGFEARLRGRHQAAGQCARVGLEQNAKLVFDVADDIVTLDSGCVAAEGSAAQVKENGAEGGDDLEPTEV
jgi:ABC-type branched-subunit amino acid transport system ATPase component